SRLLYPDGWKVRRAAQGLRGACRKNVCAGWRSGGKGCCASQDRNGVRNGAGERFDVAWADARPSRGMAQDDPAAVEGIGSRLELGGVLPAAEHAGIRGDQCFAARLLQGDQPTSDGNSARRLEDLPALACTACERYPAVGYVG